MSPILTRAQAEAANAAMVALNSVNGRIHVRMAVNDRLDLHILELEPGRIHVFIADKNGDSRGRPSESHDDRNAFVRAYDLNGDG